MIEKVEFIKSQSNAVNIDILNYIPTGSKNAIGRKYLASVAGLSDRSMRNEIHNARRKIPVLNLSDGTGYYIPDMNDPIDRMNLAKYVRQEESRISEIGWALKASRQTLRNCNIDWKKTGG
mgnify:CR=1 FL=1